MDTPPYSNLPWIAGSYRVTAGCAQQPAAAAVASRLSLNAGLRCERSDERGAVLGSRCDVDRVPADECEGYDDRAVAQAMQLLRRLSVDVLMQRCVCDLF